jgi:hypothetical protein
MNKLSGIVFAAGLTPSMVMPARNQRSSVPSKGPSPTNTSEYPNATQRIEIMVTAARLCAIVASTFSLRTMPD